RRVAETALCNTAKSGGRGPVRVKTRDYRSATTTAGLPSATDIKRAILHSYCTKRLILSLGTYEEIQNSWVTSSEHNLTNATYLQPAHAATFVYTPKYLKMPKYSAMDVDR